MAELVIRKAGRILQALRLERLTVRIGRADGNDLVLHGPDVSRHHATIEYQAGGYIIRDEGSRNGLLVDGQSVPLWRLVPGVRVQVGEYDLELRDDGAIVSDGDGRVRTESTRLDPDVLARLDPNQTVGLSPEDAERLQGITHQARERRKTVEMALSGLVVPARGTRSGDRPTTPSMPRATRLPPFSVRSMAGTDTGPRPPPARHPAPAWQSATTVRRKRVAASTAPPEMRPDTPLPGEQPATELPIDRDGWARNEPTAPSARLGRVASPKQAPPADADRAPPPEPAPAPAAAEPEERGTPPAAAAVPTPPGEPTGAVPLPPTERPPPRPGRRGHGTYMQAHLAATSRRRKEQAWIALAVSLVAAAAALLWYWW